MADNQTAEDIVRLLAEELADPGRERLIYDSYNARRGETFHLSLPLRRMVREWVKSHPRVTIGDLVDGRY